MKIRVTDWQFQNLRIGGGSESFELGDPPARWSLIQMPNGLGKTSTMTLIRAILGEERLSPEKVRSFRANDKVEKGSFELGLLIERKSGEPQNPYRLIVELDFNNGSYQYSTLRNQERGGGREPGLLLPSDLKHILKPEFIKLFVFDGELARAILDLNRNAADRAIRTIYQIDDISTLQQRIKDAVSNRQKTLDGTSGKTKTAVSRHRNKVEQANTVLNRLKNDLQQKISTKSKVYLDLEKIKEKINEHIERHGDLKVRKERLVDKAELLDSEIQSITKQAHQSFRNPTTLSTVMTKRLKVLGETLTRARLPKSVSSNFFEEVAQEGTCICGRSIGTAERETLLRRKEQYLAQDQIAAIATMKESLYSPPDGNSFLDSCEKLQQKIEDLRRNEKEEARLKKEAEERGDVDMSPLKEKERKKNEELVILNRDIECLQTSDLDKQREYNCSKNTNIPLAIRYRDACIKTLTQVEDSYRLSCQREKLLDQLDRVEKKSLTDLREIIRKETNERLETLVKMEDLRVERIDGALELSSDKAIKKDDVSEGQSLSVAYAFLTALLSKAPFELPFIVDSPVVSLDLDVRKEVSNVIPTLFKQIIFFVISSEQAAFAENFYGSEDAKFITLRKTADGSVTMYSGLEEFQRKTTDGETI